MPFLLCLSFSAIVFAQQNVTRDQVSPESEFFWTMMTMSCMLLGVGVLLYIHACLTRIRDEDRLIVYEAAPLMGPKVPPPPSYEQVI